MRNEFSGETKELFYTIRHCMNCGRVDLPLEVHHICGRQGNSPLNGIMLCIECHENIRHTKEYEEFLFKKTVKFLKNKYIITEKDKDFISNNPHLIGLF